MSIHLGNEKIHISGVNPKLELQGTEANAKHLSIRENAGVIEIYDEDTGTPIIKLNYDASPTPTPNTIPVADTNGQIDAGWVKPAGLDGQIQYNNGGVIGGDSDLVWDSVNKTFKVGGGASSINLVKNGGFHSGFSGWAFYVNSGNGASASRTTDTADYVFPPQSAKITITNGGTADYNIQFYGGISDTSGVLIPDKYYTLSFWAKANTTVSIRVAVMLDYSPWTVYLNKGISLTTSWQKFSFSFKYTGTASDRTRINFYLGNAGAFNCWLDGITLVHGNVAPEFVPFTIRDNGETTFVGNMGIGVPTPSYQLELSQDSAAKPSTNTWTVTSDERLKENIELADLNRCYEIVKNLPLKRFKWRDDVYTPEQVKDRRKLGWISQDVEKVFPKAVDVHEFRSRVEIDEVDENGNPIMEEVVIEPERIDEDGNVIPAKTEKRPKKKPAVVIEDCKTLNADQIYAVMYGAVQLLIQKVERLEKENKELRRIISEIQKR